MFETAQGAQEKMYLVCLRLEQASREASRKGAQAEEDSDWEDEPPLDFEKPMDLVTYHREEDEPYPGEELQRLSFPTGHEAHQALLQALRGENVLEKKAPSASN
jgi:hypothetical protein